MRPFTCAIVGASGMVGGMFAKLLEERNLPVKQLHLFSSARSAGRELLFRGESLKIEKLTPDVFNRGIDIALFAVGNEISREYAPIAVKAGCVVVDNSSAWRMEPGVPLVVPEVNRADIAGHKGIISNPNCCAVPAVIALKPLLDTYGLSRVVISTYQSVSGAGVAGLQELEKTAIGLENKHFPHPIANNLFPHIGGFENGGYTGEEKKLMAEVRKMLGSPELGITATAVRVPVKIGHSLSLNITLGRPFELAGLRALLSSAPGAVLSDDTENNLYPTPLMAAGTDAVYIGRLRRDTSFKDTINLWLSADNTRKGAATNAVQIVEELFKNSLL